jgi:hypothetical protein
MDGVEMAGLVVVLPEPIISSFRKMAHMLPVAVAVGAIIQAGFPELSFQEEMAIQGERDQRGDQGEL